MLEAHSLSCRRGGRAVFRGVGFVVNPGGLLLVTGANGSGKSSLLRVLAGLIAPHAGIVRWQNADITADTARHRARLRYIGHLDAVKPQLTVREMLDYWRVLRGGAAEGTPHCLAAFDLKELEDRLVRTLSAGQRRRLSLTRLVQDSALLWLLDEPTAALDAQGKELLYSQIAQHRAKGGIVIAATHGPSSLPDAQLLAMPGVGA